MISSGHLISSSSLTILNCFIVACRDESPTWVRQKRPAPPCQVKKTCMHQGGTTQVVSIILLLFAFVHVWAPNVWKTYPCIVFLFLGLSWFLSLLLTVFFHCTSICFADAICAFLYRREQSESGKTQGLNGKKKGINKLENLVFYQCLSIVLKHFDVMIVCRFCDF